MDERRAGVSEEALAEWVSSAAGGSGRSLGSGYQGHVFLFERGDVRLVVKTAPGRGPLALARRVMLRGEHRIYQRLHGLEGVPECYGMLQNRHLVLGYVDGVPFRKAEILDRDRFFTRLLELIRQIHARGVAHGDLKKKDNLLVVDGRIPCIVDFGVAVARKRRPAPLNRYWFGLASTFDYNAWAKLKSQGDLSRLADHERALVRRTLVERIASTLKSGWLRARRALRI